MNVCKKAKQLVKKKEKEREQEQKNHKELQKCLTYGICPKCGHSDIKVRFWRWAADKASCNKCKFKYDYVLGEIK